MNARLKGAMRRRDVVFVCVAWGALLAGLAWALATQFRLVQEAKPAAPKPLEAQETESNPPPPAAATGVIGTVSDDTREAMAQESSRRHAKAKPGSASKGSSAKEGVK